MIHRLYYLFKNLHILQLVNLFKAFKDEELASVKLEQPLRELLTHTEWAAKDLVGVLEPTNTE